MNALFKDLQVATRVLLKNRLFTVVAVATLALAIGANTAIFSVVDGVLLRPLPYPNADRLVYVTLGALPQVGTGELPFSDRGYWHFVNNNHVYDKFGAYQAGNTQWPLTADGPPLQVNVAGMSLSAYEALGTVPQRGRLPTAEEDVPDASWVVLISDGLWETRYGRDPAIIGTSIELNGAPREVIGIMPAGYDFPTPETDVWLPLHLNPASENFGGHHLFAIGRLADGITPEAAVTDAESLIKRFDEAGYGPQWLTGVFSGKAFVRGLREQIVGDSRRPLLILLGTVGFVLLIACSNVANLLMVRAEARTRENAVRMALGSGRGRLARYVMAESVLLAVAGGIAGIFLAWVGTRALVAAGPASIPRLDAIGINGTVLAYTAVISLVAGILFGTIPGIRSGSIKAMRTLNDGGRGSTVGKERNRTRNILVVGQVALALILLVGSGLMVRSFQQLRSVDPGFDAPGLMTFRLSPPPSKYPDAEATARFYDQLIQRLEEIPGVSSAAGIDALPLTGGGAILATSIEDFPTPEGEFPPVFSVRRVTPGYFRTMGIPVVEGREFTPDDHNARMGTLLISASLKRQYWPDESGLGKRLTPSSAPARSVGVVGDVHDTGLDAPPEQFIYKPMLDSVGGGVRPLMMVVRTDGDPEALVPGIRSTVEAMDPDLPITNLRSMQDIVGASLSRTTFTMYLLILAAVIALFLGSVGIYGMLSYVATQRTAEMGVRFALGADPGMVRRIFLTQGLKLAGAGVVLGLVGALALGGVMSSLLYGIRPTDPLTLAAVSVAFLAVATLASLVPARRAARTSPAVALRAD